MSNTIELIGVIENVKTICISMATGGDFSYRKYEVERDKILSYSELKNLLPDWLISCRYGQLYWKFISNQFDNYADRRNFLRLTFDEIIDQVKLGTPTPIALSIVKSIETINNDIIKSLWRKIIQRASSDPEGAITASRTILESTIKYILKQENIAYTSKDDLGELHKKIKKNLGGESTNNDRELHKKLLAGIITIISCVAELRNTYGDSHGKVTYEELPTQRHVELAINLSGALCTFLIDTYSAKAKA